MLDKLKKKLIDIWCGKKVGGGSLRIDATTSCVREEDGSLKIKRTFPSLRTRLAWWKQCVLQYSKANSFPLSFITLMFLFGQDMLAVLVMGALAQDAIGTGDGVGTTISWSHTCTGSDRILIAGLGYGGSGSVTDISYNGTSMTQGPDANGNSVNSTFWYLANPSTGANNCVTTTGSAWQQGGSISFTGGDTTDPTGGTGTNSALSTSATVSITTQNNDSIIVDGIHTNNVPSAWGTNQTERWTSSGQDDFCGSTKSFSTAGATTMTCTITNAYYAYSAIEVNAKAVDTSPLPTFRRP